MALRNLRQVIFVESFKHHASKILMHDLFRTLDQFVQDHKSGLSKEELEVLQNRLGRLAELLVDQNRMTREAVPVISGMAEPPERPAVTSRHLRRAAERGTTRIEVAGTSPATTQEESRVVQYDREPL